MHKRIASLYKKIVIPFIAILGLKPLLISPVQPQISEGGGDILGALQRAAIQRIAAGDPIAPLLKREPRAPIRPARVPLARPWRTAPAVKGDSE